MKNLYFTFITFLVSFSSYAQILGTPSVCVGSATPLSDPSALGWTSSNPSIATVDTFTGLVTGISAGTVTISDWGALSYGAMMIVTVNAAPAPVTGPSLVCSMSFGTYSDATPGGAWSVGFVAIATISSGGILTPVTTGTTTVVYTLPGGCSSSMVITINPTPTPMTITPNPVCVGGTAILSDAASFGTWSVSDPVIGSVSVSGVLTGNTAGTTNITYALGATGCATTSVVTVNPAPVGIISTTGIMAVCIGNTTGLNDATPGGIWSNAEPGIATVGIATGIVLGIGPGTTTVSYSLPTGCWSSVVVTVNAAIAPITGTPTVCLGGTTDLSDISPGGSWASTAPAIGSVSSTGVVSGFSMGTTTISYYFGSGTGCYSTITVTVNAAPAPISGTLEICNGLTTTLSDASGGGVWSSGFSVVAPIGSASGIATGVSPGTTVITYTASVGCLALAILTVDPLPTVISGPTSVCPTGNITLTDAVAGGTWITSIPAIATVDPASGVVTGVSAGTATISYQLPTACATSYIVTVEPAPAVPVVSGTSFYCPCITFVPFTVVPSSGILWYTSATGGTGSSTAPVINTCIPGVTTNWASETAGGCESPRASFAVTVDVTPTVTASATSNCGGTFTINGGGAGTGGTYMWSPSTGLSCPACASSTATISSTATYTVTGTNAGGCSGTNTVTLAADRISGYIGMTAAPTDTVKVWLIQFNTTDSSLIAQDSTFSCMDSGTPYYEFDSKPAGNYMVKGKLLSSVPGTTGYVPTYGLSSSVWDSAATLTHAVSATDTQHINMIYGTVPPGPGFIGGLISSGAGRGTALAVPAVGMLVYLKNATTNGIITYTYTDGTGAYSFSGIANGSYTIYPVDYKYHTIPWVDITLTTTSDTAAGVGFYEHTGNKTITPYSTPVPVCCGPVNTMIGTYPNPASNELNIYWGNEPTGDADLIITDLAGREVYKSVLSLSSHSGNSKLDLSLLQNGAYILTIKSANISYTNKLTIQR